jgi:hypothetical protein
VFNTVIKRSTQYGSVANRQGVMAAMNPRGEHTQAYRHLLAELLQMVGGPGVEQIPALESAGDARAGRHSTGVSGAEGVGLAGVASTAGATGADGAASGSRGGTR